jgi:hypothetical protein
MQSPKKRPGQSANSNRVTKLNSPNVEMIATHHTERNSIYRAGRCEHVSAPLVRVLSRMLLAERREAA